jgi:cilia- and flagella-associated protein 52
MEGEVRVWKIGKQTQVMEASLKEHRGRVNDIQVSKSNEQAVSASADGSCIVWDLANFTRTICLFEKTMFKQVLYHPDEYQIITTGSDRKIAYWDAFDGQQIRNIEASEGEINALGFMYFRSLIDSNNDYFLSGGEDKMLMLWKYDEAISYYKGEGHASHIRKAKLS